MKKKVLSLLMVVVLLCVGCTATPAAPATEEKPAENAAAAPEEKVEAAAEPAVEEKPKYKIGLMSSTTVQGEEDYRCAQSLVEQYGEDRIVHVTYPNNPSTEQETTISTMMSLAADPDIKVIVSSFSIEGTTAAFEKVREKRPDIILLGALPSEDPNVLSKAADLILGLDYVGMGVEVAETANKMGAKTLFHYSFPRHMANPIYLARHDKMQEKCAELGIEFIDVTTPDPMGEGGVASTQQYVLEDVPRKISEYGTESAFFSTNMAMHEPMIKCIYEGGALFPHPDSPSPFYAYPGALGIEVPDDKKNDAQYMCDQISAKLAEKGMEGRMGTWMPPMVPLVQKTLVEYAFALIDGGYEDPLQVDLLQEIAQKYGENRLTFDLYDAALPNYQVIISETILL